MGKKESDHNAPGDFSVNPRECNKTDVCRLVTQSSLLGTKKYDGKDKTFVRRQAENEDEKMTLMIAVNSCPFDAIAYKGSPHHPEVKIYAEKIVKDPSVLPPNRRKKI